MYINEAPSVNNTQHLSQKKSTKVCLTTPSQSGMDEEEEPLPLHKEAGCTQVVG